MQPSGQQFNNINIEQIDSTVLHHIASNMGETKFSLLLFHVGNILSKKFEITLSLLSLMTP